MRAWKTCWQCLTGPSHQTNDDAVSVVTAPVVLNITSRHNNNNGCPMPGRSLIEITVAAAACVDWLFSVAAAEHLHAQLPSLCGTLSPATFFVSIDYTDPNLIRELYMGGHQIATHTVDHVAYANSSEILGAKLWLNQVGWWVEWRRLAPDLIA